MCQFMGSTMYVIVAWDFIQHLLLKYNVVYIPFKNKAGLIVDDSSSEAYFWRALIMGTFYIVLISTISF